MQWICGVPSTVPEVQQLVPVIVDFLLHPAFELCYSYQHFFFNVRLRSCAGLQLNFFLYIYLFIGCIGSSLLRVGFLQLRRAGAALRCGARAFPLQWLLLLWSTGSRCAGFSSCGTRAQQLWLAGSRAQVQQMWHMGLVAPRHVGSSQTRARTRVPCIGRRILNPCATREVPIKFLIKSTGCLLYGLKIAISRVWT